MNAPLIEAPWTDTEELDHQRAAIAALGHELRLTQQLTGRRRASAEIPAVDEFPGGTRMYSPVTGPGSPLAPPMRVTPDGDGGAGHADTP